MIETNLGSAIPDSPFESRQWVWATTPIHATRYQGDNTVIVVEDRDASVEFEDG